MICSPKCLTSFRPYSTTVTVIFVLTLRSPCSDSGKVECLQLVCTLPTWHCLLFCLVIFPLLFLKVILGGDLISVGGWLYATSSPVSLWRLAEVYLALFRQIGPELLIGLRCYFSFTLHSISPFPYPLSCHGLTLDRVVKASHIFFLLQNVKNLFWRGLESRLCQRLSLAGSSWSDIIGSPFQGRGEDSAT